MSLIIQIIIITFALTVHQCCGDCLQTGIPSGGIAHRLGSVRTDKVYSCSLACQASNDCEFWSLIAPWKFCILFQGSFDKLEMTQYGSDLKLGRNCFCHLKEEERLHKLYGTCVRYGRPAVFDNQVYGPQPSGFFVAHSVQECSDACRLASYMEECSMWAFNQKNNKCTFMILPRFALEQHLDQEGFEHIVIGYNCFLDNLDPYPNRVECVSEFKIHMDGPDEEVVGGLINVRQF